MRINFQCRRARDGRLMSAALYSLPSSPSPSSSSPASSSAPVALTIFSQHQLSLLLQQRLRQAVLDQLPLPRQRQWPDCNPLSIKTSTCVDLCPIGYYGQENLCWPENQALASRYWQDPQLSAPSNFNLFKKALFWTALLAIGAGMVWLVLVHFLPQHMPKLVIALAIVSLVVLVVLLLLKGQGYNWWY